MRWRPQRLPLGLTRERIVFALWPRLCEGGEVAWLERVRVEERVTCGFEDVSDRYWTEDRVWLRGGGIVQRDSIRGY